MDNLNALLMWIDENKVFLVTVAVPTFFALWRQYVAMKRAKTVKEHDIAMENMVDVIENAAAITMKAILKSSSSPTASISLNPEDTSKPDVIVLKPSELISRTEKAIKDELKKRNIKAVNRKVKLMFPNGKKEN